MGPLAGATIEFIKIILNFAVNGTMTAGVGEIANFLIGCSICGTGRSDLQEKT